MQQVTLALDIAAEHLLTLHLAGIPGEFGEAGHTPHFAADLPLLIQHMCGGNHLAQNRSRTQ
ncbi:hypothetical protein D3C81_1619960 [compost metagenome]